MYNSNFTRVAWLSFSILLGTAPIKVPFDHCVIFSCSYKKCPPLELFVWDVYIPHSIKFSRDKISVEINFTDEGFSLAMPTTPSSAAHFQIQVFLLRGKLRLDRAFSVSLVGAHQLQLSSRRHLPVNKRNRH